MKQDLVRRWRVLPMLAGGGALAGCGGGGGNGPAPRAPSD